MFGRRESLLSSDVVQSGDGFESMYCSQIVSRGPMVVMSAYRRFGDGNCGWLCM
jgi:hypothetical protein